MLIAVVDRLPAWTPVASLGGDTLQGVTPEGKKLWANLQRIVEKRGRTGKKGVGRHPGGGDTRVKAIKSDSDSDSDEQKRSPGLRRREKKKPGTTPQNWRLKRSPSFSGKKWRVTPSVAAPGVTHPSDATAPANYAVILIQQTFITFNMPQKAVQQITNKWDNWKNGLQQFWLSQSIAHDEYTTL